MAYLGQTAHETAFTNRVTDTMTGDGSDTTLTLSSAPISVNNVIVFIDGVMQRPTTDYTVSGTTLTFAVAPHNSANVQAITGGGEHIGVPLASVTEDQLVDGAITSAKLESGIQIPASKITSLAASKITGALPALDGSSLTSMPPTSVGIDNVTTNPSPTTNPSGGVGTIHLNKTTGEMFVCTNATTNANVWFNVGEGSGDISNTAPTNPTSTSSFPDITESSSQTFTFSGATDAEGSVTHYMVDQFSNAALSVSAAEVAAGSAHTFNTGAVGSDTAVTFRVRAKDNFGAYSSGVTVSMNVTNEVFTVASGGSVGTSGNNKYHVFTGNGTFSVSQLGSTPTISYICVAGGAGGGGNLGGGAGAGGMISSTHTLSSTGSYNITIGAGGGTSWGAGATGNNSSISGPSFSQTAIAGGGGGARYSNGSTGGSGGGAGGSHAGSGGSGTSGQGNAGGNTSSNKQRGGGGGGKGGAGTSCTNASDYSPHGGSGQLSNLDGNSYYYAGGGGGAFHSGTQSGSGGVGGAGGGGKWSGYGQTAPAGGQARNAGTSGAQHGGNGGTNTGSGGGGGGWNYGGSYGGGGGSGIVIIRYTYQ